MVYGQKEQKFGAQDKNTTVHWKFSRKYAKTY